MDEPKFHVMEDGKVVVTINGRDGKITLAPHMTVDDAARAFWDAIMAMNPYKKAIEEERERIARKVGRQPWQGAMEIEEAILADKWDV